MNNPYRNPPKEKKMKYIYAMFKVIKQNLENFYNWFSWKNFLYLLLSIVCLMFVVYFSLWFYGYLFLEKKQGDCYLTNYDSIIVVKKSIDWDTDPSISNCFLNDLECLEKILNSSVCK